MGPRIKNLLLVLAIGLALYSYFDDQARTNGSPVEHSAADPDLLARAIENRQSDVQLTGSAVVVHLLPDDTSGSQHQKFIVRHSSGATLLIAHNIDLAPRIDSLRKGDTIEYYGEYEWNDRGGVVHWTHHDPAGRHPDGWLKHGGVTYQ